MKQHSTAILLGLLLIIQSSAIFAQSRAPQNADAVVASWDVDNYKAKINMSFDERLAKAAWHIEQSQFPGQANKHYGRARALLKAFISDDLITVHRNTPTNEQQAQLLYLWARVLQHQHQFALAEQTLNQAQKLDQRNTSHITLLKASVQLSQGEFAKAKTTCAQLLGQTQIVIVAACTLEATAQQAQLKESYQQMAALLNNQPTFPDDQLSNWLLQIAADMALHLDSPRDAQKWLQKGLTGEQTLSSKPLSFVVLWADVQLASGQYQVVLSTLGNIVETAGFMDDTLLSRLAIAETHTSRTHWQALFKQRIDLRITRSDLYHAADLARYYIYIQPNAKEALHWAKLNWQQVKLRDDKMLFEQANAMQPI